VLAKKLGKQNKLPSQPQLLLPLQRFNVVMHILYRSVLFHQSLHKKTRARTTKGKKNNMDLASCIAKVCLIWLIALSQEVMLELHQSHVFPSESFGSTH
jgi:hypothetical protein